MSDNNLIPSPKTFGFPHDDWRPHQWEAIQRIKNSDKQIILLDAPTGSGKSLISAMLGIDGKSVRVVTKTKSLQTQYGNSYGFESLYGMDNYPCALTPFVMAGDCAYSENMMKCPMIGMCEYVEQRNKTKASARQVLNYAYYISAKWAKQEWVDYVFMDEGHSIRDIVMEHCAVTYKREWVERRYGVTWEVEGVIPPPMKLRKIKVFLNQVYTKVANDLSDLKREKEETEEVPKLHRLAKRIKSVTSRLDSLTLIINLMTNSPHMMYYSIDKDEIKLSPLTAKGFFNRIMPRPNRLLDDGNILESKLIIASATIGNPKVFAESLGIQPDEYEVIIIPSVRRKFEMPVYVPKSAPKINYHSNDVAKANWIKSMTDLINKCPSDWNGIIHTASGKQTEFITQELKKALPERYVTELTGEGTDGKVETLKQLEAHNGVIVVSHSIHEGVDAYKWNINIIAKVPYASLTDIIKARLNFDEVAYTADAATLVQQASGRIRRGRDEHYEQLGQPMRKMVAIVDKNVWRLKPYFSDYFKELLTEI